MTKATNGRRPGTWLVAALLLAAAAAAVLGTGAPSPVPAKAATLAPPGTVESLRRAVVESAAKTMDFGDDVSLPDRPEFGAAL